MDSTPLRQYRTDQGLTLRELADQVGVTEGQLSRIERERRTSWATARKIAEVTGLALEDIGQEAA
jgi:transcriptional regulator with XRE-family HTH domain